MSDNVPSQQLSDPIAPDAVIEVRFRCDRGMLWRAAKQSTWLSLGKRSVIWFMIFGLILISPASIGLMEESRRMAAIVCMGLGVAVGTFPFWYVWSVARSAAREHKIYSDMEILQTYSPEFVELQSPLGASRMTYQATSHVYLTDEFLYFFGAGSWYLPKRLLTAAQVGIITNRFERSGAKVMAAY